MKRSLLYILVVSNLVLIGILLSANVTINNSATGNNDAKHDSLSHPDIALRILPPKTPTKLNFAGEKVPLEIYDVRERLDRELLSNAYRHSNTMHLMKLSARYFPFIEEILIEEGVPTDFKYLALAESGLQNVVSPRGAAGFWQFMKATGIEYGLEVANDVDERYHLEKSTRAACKYLKLQKQRFGSWTLAAASYNMGYPRLENSIEDQKVDSYYELYLNSETSRYVFRILAFKEIFSNTTNYGFHLETNDLYLPIATKAVTVTETIPDLAEFAMSKGINYKTLKLLNPWLRDEDLIISSGNSYDIVLPSN